MGMQCYLVNNCVNFSSHSQCLFDIYKIRRMTLPRLHSKRCQVISHNTFCDIMNIAQSEDFWTNMVRYVQYFSTVLLGSLYAIIKPVIVMPRNKKSTLLVFMGSMGVLLFLYFTLASMLEIIEIPEL